MPSARMAVSRTVLSSAEVPLRWCVKAAVNPVHVDLRQQVSDLDPR
jgi:hypothetical protein